ncbi:D-alanine--D-alanine ligase [Carbonactinospora thermoautotrophica]|uniref:D-alanine--D-alanine ligase n=1 Tax=Carbonactinospora thermoautotrophica TaxID=1469144 RepID=A0A132MJB0_9ACTN|nr:D-alanine--D-alanine ligase [Carbonactinospora thermoautotrophica]KWW97855.1 D-alanine--D-alanine ligase [Carbonactinospora thermoautotrophica]KWW98390.1 D-alanine--D-alanine ligase [Carbonactinospora thermoautotrophica]KWX06312.1 D-alanine--D-alanine ligase [Carbonactinospora thermoautotrophica]MCX9192019.1 D-alanine--D-alanine ligase [Carbonactinospora thermoautotrophica]
MSDLGRVVVLAGGLSHERDVSLRSGRRVAEALRSVGVEVDVLDVDGALLPSLKEDRPSVVFPALHGAAGEDGAVREVLELLGIPYVGATPAACRLAFDKPTAKDVVRAAGLLTPDAVALPHAMFRDLGATAVLDAIVARLGMPLFVKPARGGSALGCSVVREPGELPAAMVNCFAYGDTALVERFVEGVEVAISVVDTGNGPTPLPAVEIVPDSGVYDYTARYTAGATEFFTPARLETAAAETAARTAVTAHQVLGLRDLSRTDLIIDEQGRPWFLEVNVAPGMTETSLLPLAASAAEIDLGTLYRDLLHVAENRG